MKVLAGIVVFHPSKNELKKTINSLSSQCDKVILYLNSSIEINDLSNTKIQIINDLTNMGLGYAHKRLIDYAINEEADYLILSDQDSIYPFDYVKEMINLRDFTLACPSWINLLSNSSERKKQFVLKENKLIFKIPEQNDCLAHAITSGMFINIKKLNSGLLPDDKLFIDWIDNDWCWRLISAGHTIRYNSNIVLKHKLGNEDTSILLRKFTKRSAIRDYYIIRNAVFLLLHRNYIIHTRSYLIKKILQHMVFSILTDLNNFSKRIPLMIKAISHGFNAKLGPYNPKLS